MTNKDANSQGRTVKVDFKIEGTSCIHLEKRVVERISRGNPLDRRPDLVLWICHFPLPSLSGFQCSVAAKGARCPHSGPYCSN